MMKKLYRRNPSVKENFIYVNNSNDVNVTDGHTIDVNMPNPGWVAFDIKTSIAPDSNGAFPPGYLKFSVERPDASSSPLDVEVSVDGTLLAEKGFLFSGFSYVPVRAIANAYGLLVRFDVATRSVYVDAAGSTPPMNNISNDSLTVYVLGRKLSNVVMKDNITYVWSREIANQLHKTITWDVTNKRSVFGTPVDPITTPTNDVIHVIVNGTKLAVDGTYDRPNGISYIPLRAVVEALGLKVYRDAVAATKYIHSNVNDINVYPPPALEAYGPTYNDTGMTWYHKEDRQLTSVYMNGSNDAYIWSRELADAFGFYINWDPYMQVVEIGSATLVNVVGGVDGGLSHSEFIWRGGWPWTRHYHFLGTGAYRFNFSTGSIKPGDKAYIRSVYVEKFEEQTYIKAIEKFKPEAPDMNLNPIEILNGPRRYQQTGSFSTKIGFSIVITDEKEYRKFISGIINYHILVGSFGVYGGLILPQDLAPSKVGPVYLVDCTMNCPTMSGVGS